MALQNNADASKRKIASHENNLRNMTRERDAAVSQLGVAYLSSQELKAENHSLKEENEKLKRQLANILGGDSRQPKHFGEYTARSQETYRTGQQTTTRDTAGIAESEYSTHQSIGERHQSRKDRSGTAKRKSQASIPDGSRNKISNQINEHLSRLNKQQEEDSLFSIDLPSLLPQHGNKNRIPMQPAPEKKPNTGRQRVKKVVVEDIESKDDDSEVDMEAMTGDLKTRSEVDEDQDMTILSFIDVSSLPILLPTWLIYPSRRLKRLRSSGRLLKMNAPLASAPARQPATQQEPTLWHQLILRSLPRVYHASQL